MEEHLGKEKDRLAVAHLPENDGSAEHPHWKLAALSTLRGRNSAGLTFGLNSAAPTFAKSARTWSEQNEHSGMMTLSIWW